jgi:hypothetical protein
VRPQSSSSTETGYNGTEARIRVGRVDTPPPVFFVRVANTGLRLDATSRIVTKGAEKREVEEVGEVEEAEMPSGADGAGEIGVGNPSRLRANMENDSMDLDYCQGNGTIIYHSNVRRGSGMDGRSWREFCSLVRR